MVTGGAAGDGRYAGDDTTDTAVVMEEAILVCPDLIDAVSESLVTSDVTVAIVDDILEDNEGVLAFNIDMPRESNTLLAAAIRFLRDLGVDSLDLSVGGSGSLRTNRSRDRPLAHHVPIQSPIEGRSRPDLCGTNVGSPAVESSLCVK